MPRESDQGAAGVGFNRDSAQANNPMVKVDRAIRSELNVIGSMALTADFTTVMFAPQMTVVSSNAASARNRWEGLGVI